MTDEKKQQLFPYFAYLFSKQINPEKYGKVKIEQWTKLIEKSPEDMDIIAEAASKLTDEDWNSIEQEYMKLQNNDYETDSLNYQDIELAKKGAKLKKLQSMKKGKKVGAKKCSCGCDMVSTKAKGGKLIYKCSCGCGAKK